MGIQRLTFLPTLIPGPYPPGWQMGHDPEPGQFLECLRDYVRNNIDPELLVDRKALWESYWDEVQWTPDWMTLTPDMDLQIYKKILTEDLGCSYRASVPFVGLARRGKRGFMEATRILSHFFKDKDLGDGRSTRLIDDPEANSRWLLRACEEALAAIDAPDTWSQGPWATSKGATKGKSRPSWFPQEGPQEAPAQHQGPWVNYQGQEVHHTGASSSSGDKGKGKGKEKRQGLR